MGALFIHGRPKKELGTHGKEASMDGCRNIPD
jgi:hypothetical protein